MFTFTFMQYMNRDSSSLQVLVIAFGSTLRWWSTPVLIYDTYISQVHISGQRAGSRTVHGLSIKTVQLYQV